MGVIGLFIGILITFAIIIAIVFMVFKTLQKSSQFQSSKYDKSSIKSITNTQSLLPFKDIARNRIDLGNHKYTALLKVEPYNYMIRSSAGKDSFALRLRRAFNSMPFKTTLFTHTRKMTTDSMLRNLSQSIDETVRKYPDIQQYGDEYFKTMSVINVKDADTGALRRVKDYYIVISWEPGSDNAGMGENQLEDVANDELKSRLRVTENMLNQAGVKTRFLTTEEIIYLLTDIYHRDESNRADLSFDGSYQSVMVSGDTYSLSAPKEANLRSILEGTISEIGNEIIDNPNINSKVRKIGLQVMDKVGQVRDQLATRTSNPHDKISK